MTNKKNCTLDYEFDDENQLLQEKSLRRNGTIRSLFLFFPISKIAQFSWKNWKFPSASCCFVILRDIKICLDDAIKITTYQVFSFLEFLSIVYGRDTDFVAAGESLKRNTQRNEWRKLYDAIYDARVMTGTKVWSRFTFIVRFWKRLPRF